MEKALAGKGWGRESAGRHVNGFRPYYKYLRPVRWQFALGLLAALIYAAATGLGMPLMVDVVFPVLFGEGAKKDSWYVQWMTNELGHVSKDSLLFYTCLWIPLIFLIRAGADYASSYLIEYSGQRVVEGVRMDLFKKLQSLPLSFFKKNPSGDLLSRLMNDTAIFRQVIANASSDLIKQPATLVGALGYLTFKAVTDHSFFIAMVSMVTVPLCVLVIRAAGKKLERRARTLQAQSGNLTTALTEAIQAPLEIRAYNLQEKQISSFHQQIQNILRTTMKVVKYRKAISPSIEVVAACGFAVALFLGVRAGMSQSGFLTLGMALFMSYEPIKKLGAIHSLFKQGKAAAERIEYILHEQNHLSDPASPMALKAPTEAIRFDRLSFAYGSEPVLKEIDLTIRVGQVVALVGPSGAGKSTFAHLIPRFYDPTAGAITFDGIDIREFRKSDVRNAIAVVPQMPSLFIGTIADNIRVGRENATDEEVRAAARKAHADEFIRNLTNGYETQVGERGDLLSGGQRQRIAIARAFLKDAPILILDEATSALDAESEAMVQQALAALVKGRTTFIIAHRYSTITIADRVLVFDQGRIIADGNHESLRETSSIYRSMISSL